MPTQEETVTVASRSKDMPGAQAATAAETRQEEIRLISRDGSEDQDGVRFYVSPELSETRTVNYQEISEMRQAGGLLIYIGTQARTYSLTARFVSRTTTEATKTFKYTHMLKSWTVPNKSKVTGGTGQGAGGGIDASENAPEVLKLYGYGSNQIRGVPVVITSLTIDYPANVTYVPTDDGTALIPIIQTFNISLKEARNMEELEKFNLINYKLGILKYW